MFVFHPTECLKIPNMGPGARKQGREGVRQRSKEKKTVLYRTCSLSQQHRRMCVLILLKFVIGEFS